MKKRGRKKKIVPTNPNDIAVEIQIENPKESLQKEAEKEIHSEEVEIIEKSDIDEINEEEFRSIKKRKKESESKKGLEEEENLENNEQRLEAVDLSE